MVFACIQTQGHFCAVDADIYPRILKLIEVADDNGDDGGGGGGGGGGCFIDTSQTFGEIEVPISMDPVGSGARALGDEELDIPMSYGIGVAYRFSDTLTTSLDLYRIEWDDFLLRDENGNEISPITGEPAGESDIDPKNQVRMGIEYLVIADTYVVPIRGGLFYDPAPADGGSDAFYGCSFGTGFAKGKIALDFAYQYRFGNDVAEFILEEFEYSQDIREHTIYASVIYHF